MQEAARGTRSPRRISHVDVSVDSPLWKITSLEKNFSCVREVRRRTGQSHRPRLAIYPGGKFESKIGPIRLILRFIQPLPTIEPYLETRNQASLLPRAL